LDIKEDTQDMFTGVYQSLILMFALVVFFVLNFAFLKRYSKHRTDQGFKWVYTLKFIVVSVLVCVQPIWLPILGVPMASTVGMWVQWGGITMIVLSQLLHVWARLHLRHFYTEGHNVQPKHYVVSSGPYAYVRHPLFSSYILFAFGMLLINPALTTLVVLAYVWWNFRRAAIKDEDVMSKNVVGYEDSMKHTPRFIPRLW
jgi:protein-S-isoprenylcysteine O-methyltransferase Ste14